jgi:hypothetical protein
MMAMLSQAIPLSSLGCPAGVCRGQERVRAQTSWKALVGSFAAGALAVSAAVALAGGTPAAPNEPQIDARQQAAAAESAALVREQTPRELPPEWRWEIKPVRFDGMFRKQR